VDRLDRVDEFDLVAWRGGAAQARIAWPVRSRRGSPGSLPPIPGWTLAFVRLLATTMLAWVRAFGDQVLPVAGSPAMTMD
jgi:hypothetical protein